jgi:hypothetical protein
MMILNDDFNKLKLKYTDKVLPNARTPAEVLSFVETNFKICQTDINDRKNQELMQMFKLNFNNSLEGYDSIIQDRNIVLLQILKDDKSNIYYDESPVQIYFIIDLKSGYFDCNNNLLRSKLYIYNGISKYDISENSPKLHTYLLALDSIV